MNQNEIKTVAIVGGTLWGNRGAEAMLVTTIGRIRQADPTTRFKVFSYYPETDRQLCNDPTIEFYDYRPLTIGLKVFPLAMLAWAFSLLRIRLPDACLGRELAAIRSSSVMCDVGGITFCDGREIFLLYNVLSILPAIMLKVPVVKLSQAMGPFKGRLNRFLANRILPRCQYVFARGKITAEHLKSIKLPSSTCSDAADVAFAYQPEYSLTTENEPRIDEFLATYAKNSSNANQTVAIVPSSLVMKKNPDYINQLVELVVELSAANIHVLLLPNATRCGVDSGRNNDLVAIKAIVMQLAECKNAIDANVTHVDFDINTDGIRRLMQRADLVVTSRFHGMVAALSAALPTIVIGWSHKYAEVLEQFGIQHLSIDHKQTDQQLAEQVLRVLMDSGKNGLVEQLNDRLTAVRESSARQLRMVSELLGALQHPAADKIPAVTSAVSAERLVEEEAC